ncbi:MAG: hypothetical protein MJZ71_07200 [Bacteroidales bacterium]|nr:hypothetical protein [Bacteroidales bacterium]
MKRVKIFLLGLILVFASATCFVACDPEENEGNNAGETETPFNATNLSLEEINDILVGTWVQTRDDPYYGRDTIDFLESGIIHETFPKYLRNHDGWNYNLTRDSIFTFISGEVWELYEIFPPECDNRTCFIEVNNRESNGEIYRDQWIYNLILSKEGNDFYIILPGWHPNGLAEEGTLEFHKFKKVK